MRQTGYYSKPGRNNCQDDLDEYGISMHGQNQERYLFIADGGGYDNLTLADKVKEELIRRNEDRIAGAKTPVTANAITGETHTGTYLLDYLVGSANTMLPTTHNETSYIEKDIYKRYITDSSAAGTALSSGYKTIYCYSVLTKRTAPDL